MKALLVLGVLLVLFVVACGRIDITVWSINEPTPATSGGTLYGGRTSSISAPAGLGEGARTAADARWIYRMNLICARRNARERAVSGPQDTTLSLARYSAQTLWIWDDYERRARSIRVPRTYAREASWVRQVDASKRQGIQTVLDVARAQNKPAAHAAIDAFGNLSRNVYPGLAKIGLATCAVFHP